jgi:hypothetical protein
MYFKKWLRSQLRRILNLLRKRLDQGQFHPKLEALKTDLSLPGIKPESESYVLLWGEKAITGTESGIE